VTGLDPRKYFLPAEVSERIFQQEIAPQELAHGRRQAEPIVVFVAGQPGAGKTRTAVAVQETLRDRHPVSINGDIFKPYHPDYARLVAEDDQTASGYTSLDARRWLARAEQYLIDHRFDAIIDTTMRDRDDFDVPAAHFRQAGYRVQVAILAVPQAQSRQGILTRYNEQVRDSGYGRLTLTSTHDLAYRSIPEAAARIDDEHLVDAVAVYRRGNHLLYDNELISGAWRETPDTAGAIRQERQRQWTYQEATGFLTDLDHLRAELGPGWQVELQAVRRLADPLLPPGAEAVHLTGRGHSSERGGSHAPANPQDRGAARGPAAQRHPEPER
jgi:hypothetical protein